MPHRLPLELELTILELAAPPLASYSLHERVAFFIKISLVHRSLKAWAQERLHDQFLYTYWSREDEYARLEWRLAEAGFGPTRPMKRLYLDATRLRHPGDPYPRWVFESQETPAASGWTLGSLLSRCARALDTLWLMPPFADLDLSDIAHLEVFVACELSVPGQEPGFDWVPRSVRHIHILQRNSIYVDSHHPALPATFPVLESLTFTWLQPSEFGIPGVDIANPLPDLRRFVESSVVAPRCTFKYLRSSKLSEDALADAMADLGLDS